jgi:hypothetical protein
LHVNCTRHAAEVDDAAEKSAETTAFLLMNIKSIDFAVMANAPP